jgi:hypothetical protein
MQITMPIFNFLTFLKKQCMQKYFLKCSEGKEKKPLNTRLISIQCLTSYMVIKNPEMHQLEPEPLINDAASGHCVMYISAHT